MHYQTNNVWDTLTRELGCKKVASNLKSLSLRFLHHFIASTVQCRTGSFAKLTTEKGEQAQDSAIPTLGQIMDVLGEIQLGIGHLNSRLNSMDEHLDSLGTQVAAIDRKVSLGVSTKELHDDLTQSQSSEATQSPPHA